MDVAALGPVPILKARSVWAERNRLISEFLNRYFAGRSSANPVQVLEAGCGTQWNLNLSFDYVLTGVDASREAMEIRKERHNDLDKMIVGDLATVPIASEAFDVVYCCYVLEHVKGAAQVLDRLFGALRGGGLAVLVFPDRDSAFGFITRCTPHWVHVLYYKYVRKYRYAGLPGRSPFPTYYDKVVSRRGMLEYCRERGYDVVLEFGMPTQIPAAAGIFTPLVFGALKIVALGSFGTLTDGYQNLAMIIRKP